METAYFVDCLWCKLVISLIGSLLVVSSHFFHLLLPKQFNNNLADKQERYDQNPNLKIYTKWQRWYNASQGDSSKTHAFNPVQEMKPTTTKSLLHKYIISKTSYLLILFPVGRFLFSLAFVWKVCTVKRMGTNFAGKLPSGWAWRVPNLRALPGWQLCGNLIFWQQQLPQVMYFNFLSLVCPFYLRDVYVDNIQGICRHGEEILEQ